MISVNRWRRLAWLSVVAVTTAATGCSARTLHVRGPDAPAAAIPCRGGRVARIADSPGDVVDDLRPGQQGPFPRGLDLRAVAFVDTGTDVCATWRLAAPLPPKALLILLLYRASDGGGGVPVEIDIRASGRKGEVAAGGYGDDEDSFRLLRAQVRQRGDQVTAVIARSGLPRWRPRPGDLVWAAITRGVVHGAPLTDRAPSPPVIGLRYITGRPCEATALRC
jgi:hypothetical protein